MTLNSIIHSFIHSLIQHSLSIPVLEFMAKHMSLSTHIYCMPGIVRHRGAKERETWTLPLRASLLPESPTLTHLDLGWEQRGGLCPTALGFTLSKPS